MRFLFEFETGVFRTAYTNFYATEVLTYSKQYELMKMAVPRKRAQQ